MQMKKLHLSVFGETDEEESWRLHSSFIKEFFFFSLKRDRDDYTNCYGCCFYQSKCATFKS